jgi:hypothetical protein
MRSPVYGFNVVFDGLSTGSHTLELKNIIGSVYVDGFTLKSATTSASPAYGPGQTSSGSGTINVGGELLKSITLAEGTTAISVIAESSSNAPIRLVLVNPLGVVLGIADASNGSAVIEKTVAQGGTYLIKVVNLSIGPVEVFTAATPLVAR